jgi:hypothetical protein
MYRVCFEIAPYPPLEFKTKDEALEYQKRWESLLPTYLERLTFFGRWKKCKNF